MDNNQNDFYKQPYDYNYNQQYNSAPVAQPNGMSLAAMICGIAGFVTGSAASIAALILSSMYKKRHNGEHCTQSRVGFRCGLISLIVWAVIVVFYWVIYVAILGASISEFMELELTSLM